MQICRLTPTAKYSHFLSDDANSSGNPYSHQVAECLDAKRMRISLSYIEKYVHYFPFTYLLLQNGSIIMKARNFESYFKEIIHIIYSAT